MLHSTNTLICLTIILITSYEINATHNYKVRTVELASNWTLRNHNGSIEVNVPRIPSGVYTALSSRYGDVLQSRNDVDLRWISHDNWTYTKTFTVNQADYDHVRAVDLTLHGIDTISTIRLNEVEIGRTDNMFVRYSFNVLPYLRQDNRLEIEIMSPVQRAKQRAQLLKSKNINSPPDCPHAAVNGECHRNMVRKMQASYGSEFTLAAPSLGITKSIFLEYYEVAIMRDVDVALRKNDSHWTMDVRAFLDTSLKEDFYAETTLFAADLLQEPYIISDQVISHSNPKIEFKVVIPLNRVKEWWPNGYGDQRLYPLFFTAKCWQNSTLTKAHAKTTSQKSIKIGFRTLELVEDLDDYGRTFYFKVNGHPIFLKGANYLPSHILPELASDPDRVKHLLLSAKESHMNMIRIWGGGLYESDYFYSMADYYGILIWQDMAFTHATYPITDECVESIRDETAQNAKRIAHHPSLALIVTNAEIELYLVKNKTDFGGDADRLEDDYKKLFTGTIKHELNIIIARNEYKLRPGPMISTPSLGVEESKKELPSNPQDPNYGDVHFWEPDKDACDPDIYPKARFVSEYGFQSLPVRASWQRSLGENDTVVSLIKHRQHDKHGFRAMMQSIKRHLPLPTEKAEQNVGTLIYFSQVDQARALKTATETFRSQRAHFRTMGALYWQLNDVWVAPSWSTIDFYGNYKISYYWSKQFFSPIAIMALYESKTKSVNVVVARDEVAKVRDSRAYQVTVHTYLWSQLYPRNTTTMNWNMESNTVEHRLIPLDTILPKPFTAQNAFFELCLIQDNTVLSSTIFFPENILKAEGIMDPELKVDISAHYCNDDTISDHVMNSYSLAISIKHPALFVYIEVVHENVTRYKLSDNGFVQVDPVKSVHLEFKHKTKCVNLMPNHIKVLTMNQFMQKPLTTRK